MSRRFSSIAGFVRFLETRPAAMREAEQRGMKMAGEMFVGQCHTLIGQELDSWAPLAAATVLEKERLGYTGRVSPTDPLLRRGDLSLSFSYQVDGTKLRFGSDDPVMRFHEYGTERMPPRPVIGPVLASHGQESVEVVGNMLAGALAGRSGPLKPLPAGVAGDE